MPHKIAVVIALCLIAAACDGAQEKESSPPLAGAALGEQLFSACAYCHSTEPPDAPETNFRFIGPTLWGVVGRPSAALEDYDYSPAMRRAELVWNEETLDQFIANPQMLVPGSRMSFNGEQDAERRAAIIEYLKTLK